MLLLLLACLDHTPAPGSEASFVAMQSDFAAFERWETVLVTEADTGHVSGDRVVYINNPPSDEASVFPVGTIFVKTIAWSGGTDIHAMVKRGGDFNAEGARGWEWFELVYSEEGEPVILWRGEGAPEPGAYGVETDTAETVSGDCNVCHGAFAANDFVHSVALGG